MISVSPKKVAVRREMLALKGDIMAVSDDMGRSKGTFAMVCEVVRTHEVVLIEVLVRMDRKILGAVMEF